MDPILTLPLSSLVAVYGAFMLGLVSPGPDFILVTALALGRGRRQALLAAAGISLGVGFWVMASAAGLATLIQNAPGVWEAVRLSGGGLLIYLGARSLSAAIRNEPGRAQKDPEDSSGKPFLLGLITNLANPKAVIVLVGLTAVLAESYPQREVLLVTVLGMPILTLAWFSTLATVLARSGIRDKFQKYSRGLSAAMGAALAVAGILLIQAAEIG